MVKTDLLHPRSPLRTLLYVLMLVFGAEFGVMVLLKLLSFGWTDSPRLALLDATLTGRPRATTPSTMMNQTRSSRRHTRSSRWLERLFRSPGSASVQDIFDFLAAYFTPCA